MSQSKMVIKSTNSFKSSTEDAGLSTAEIDQLRLFVADRFDQGTYYAVFAGQVLRTLRWRQFNVLYSVSTNRAKLTFIKLLEDREPPQPPNMRRFIRKFLERGAWAAALYGAKKIAEGFLGQLLDSTQPEVDEPQDGTNEHLAMLSTRPPIGRKIHFFPLMASTREIGFVGSRIKKGRRAQSMHFSKSREKSPDWFDKDLNEKDVGLSKVPYDDGHLEKDRNLPLNSSNFQIEILIWLSNLANSEDDATGLYRQESEAPKASWSSKKRFIPTFVSMTEPTHTFRATLDRDLRDSESGDRRFGANINHVLYSYFEKPCAKPIGLSKRSRDAEDIRVSVGFFGSNQRSGKNWSDCISRSSYFDEGKNRNTLFVIWKES